MKHPLPNRNEIGPHTPLRLSAAAEIAFPNGGVTAASLRREAARGNLDIERIAGKDFVTLAAIEEMRTKCGRKAASSFGSNQLSLPKMAIAPESQFGSSEMDQSELALDAAKLIAQRLKSGLPPFSPKKRA
jgi:hypothetical protein